MLPPRSHLLPGAQRFADGMEEDLLGHGALVVRTPDRSSFDFVESIASPRFGKFREFRSISADALMRNSQPLRELAGLLGITPCDQPQQLLEHPGLTPTAVWVDGWATCEWDRGRWWRMVEAIAAANRAQGQDRIITLIIAVPPDALDWVPEPNRATGDRWWWGTFDRTDARISVATLTEASELVAECAIELAGFDIDLAVAIAQECAPSGLVDCTTAARLIGEAGPDDVVVAPAAESSAVRPHLNSIDGWSKGLVEYWDGQERLHPRSHREACAAAIQKRLWRGQCRALFPGLEDLRSTIAAWVLRHEDDFDAAAVQDAFDKDPRAQAIADLTSGALWTLLRTLRGRHQNQRLVRLSGHVMHLRNNLAHGQAVDATDAARLVELTAEVSEAFALNP